MLSYCTLQNKIFYPIMNLETSNINCVYINKCKLLDTCSMHAFYEKIMNFTTVNQLKVSVLSKDMHVKLLDFVHV